MQSVIAAFGYHDQKSPRHTNVCKELSQDGARIIECHTRMKGLFGKYRDLIRQYRRLCEEITGVYVTFPGSYLVPLAWVLTRYPRKHLMFDAFISLYDTLVLDRKKYPKWHPYAWFLFFIDFLSMHLADEIIIDTKEHGKFFHQKFGVRLDRTRVIYVGSREDLFYPKNKKQNPITSNMFNVFFYGSYIPLQGVEHIIQAAYILRDHRDIHFTLVGSGQTYSEMRQLASSLNVTNITFREFVALEELPDLIRAADLCLGIFGTTSKAQRVIPHKVFDALACGIPILTSDTPAIRELFERSDTVFLCRAGDPDVIAESILARVEKSSCYPTPR